jgi:hypothetical protein
MPEPVGVSVPMMKRSKAPCLFRKPRAQQRRAQVAGGAYLQRDVAIDDDAPEIGIRHGGGTAVDVKRDVRPHRQEVISRDRARPGDRRAAGVTCGYKASPLCGCDQRDIVVGRLHRAEPCLGKPHAVGCQLGKIRLVEPGLKNDGPCVHAHPARPVVLETLARGDGERFDAFRALGRPGTCTSEAEMAVVVPPWR